MARSAIWSVWSRHVCKIWYAVAHALRNLTKNTCKTHFYVRTKPLKLIMNEAKNHSELVKPANFNIDVILDIMGNS